MTKWQNCMIYLIKEILERDGKGEKDNIIMGD
jgi:hypothetical protein